MTDKPSDKPINDGGPAFPGEQGHTHEHGWNQTRNTGMSLRAWLTGRYVAAFASPDFTTPAHRTEMVRHALAYADDTIAALDAPPGE